MDAWDQKPPAIHYTYALLYRVWPHPSVVAAADLLAAAGVALLLVLLERRLTGGPGFTAAIVFLAAGQPGVLQVGGHVAARASARRSSRWRWPARCSACAAPRTRPARRGAAHGRCALAAGLLVGLAAAFKYNAALCGVAALAAAAAWRHGGRREQPAWMGAFLLDAAGLAAGAALPLMLVAARFACGRRVGRSLAGDDHVQPAVLRRNLCGPGGHDPLRGHLPDSAGANRRAVAGGRRGLPRLLLTRVRRDARRHRGACLGGGSLRRDRRQRRARAAAVASSRRTPRWPRPPHSAPGTSTGASRAHWVAAVAGAAGPARAVARGADAEGRRGHAVRRAARGRRHPPRSSIWPGSAASAPPTSTSRWLWRASGNTSPATARRADTVFVCGFAQGALVQSRRRARVALLLEPAARRRLQRGPSRVTAPPACSTTCAAARPAIVALQVNDWQMEGIDSAGCFMSRPELAGLAADRDSCGSPTWTTSRSGCGGPAVTADATRLSPGARRDRRAHVRVCLFVIAAAAILLRGLFPLADPPWQIPGRGGLARRGRVDAQRDGTWRCSARGENAIAGTRCASRRCFNAPRIRVVPRVRRRPLAGAARVRGASGSHRCCWWLAPSRLAAGRTAGAMAATRSPRRTSCG
ncbi:MAG: hypothetical protein MZU84_03895 [Sphingobacterium sp.]|nr:hypothetical protein [Sphingobacterium sp.]